MNSQARCERIGHRGAPREFFENTLPSFRRAVELGADAIELDVHLALDGVPVIHHDPSLPGDVHPPALRRAPIAGTSSADLAKVRFRSGEALPTLEDVVRELAAKVFVYAELKGGSPDIVARILEPYAGSVAIHSFDHAAIERLARIAPDIPRGIAIERVPPDLVGLIERTGARDLWPEFHLVKLPLMALAATAGVRVIPWTVDRAAQAKRLVALGVAGICTNDLTLLQAAW